MSSMYPRLFALTASLAAAAQKVYDGWNQDKDDHNGGGICQDMADAMADVIIEAGINVYIMDSLVGEQHVWVIAYNDNEAWHVDIPTAVYETGGGYTWTKIPDVQIDETDISIQKTDRETLNFVKNENY